jgi:hypothetical protein
VESPAEAVLFVSASFAGIRRLRQHYERRLGGLFGRLLAGGL